MAILGAMAACSSHDRALHPRPVFSPNGEILSGGGKGAPSCPEILGTWWDKLAGAQGGQLGKDVFLADANSEFDAMDLDHDGFITPSELSEYRAAMEESAEDQKMMPPDQLQQSAEFPSRRRLPIPGDPRGERGLGDGPAPQPPHYSQIPADVVDSVMSADKSLSFKVSRDDFLAQAKEVFAELDKDHDGRLSKEETVKNCPSR